MVKMLVLPDPPSTQTALELRLENCLAEVDCLLEACDGRARGYMQTASQAVWKAVTLARQGL